MAEFLVPVFLKLEVSLSGLWVKHPAVIFLELSLKRLSDACVWQCLWSWILHTHTHTYLDDRSFSDSALCGLYTVLKYFWMLSYNAHTTNQPALNSALFSIQDFWHSYHTWQNSAFRTLHTFQSTRFPDFSSKAGKDSSIYCLTLWSTVVESQMYSTSGMFGQYCNNFKLTISFSLHF